MLIATAAQAWAAKPIQVAIDGAAPGAVFSGIGAVSAGSSRLLIDYPEPQRSQILDYLFKPNYGASLQQLKVEIGGDGNSNAAAEPSHMHAPGDLDFHRGYEWWLMAEAKRRNPSITLSALAWNFPGWVGKAESQATADYLVQFLRGAKQAHGLDIDSIGIWNETQMHTDFIKRLAAVIRAAGLKTRIVADDSVNSWAIVDAMGKDPTLRAAVDVIATHYPRLSVSAKVSAQAAAWDKPIWSSEDGPWDDTWGAWGQQSQSYAEVLNRNYIGGRLNATLLWSLVTAHPDNLGLPYSGLVRAYTPWSGHYEVMSPTWVVAHTTQFAQPGWHYIDRASARIPGGGSYVTLHDGRQFSVVVETMAAHGPVSMSFEVRGGLSRGPVYVWRTSRDAAFVRVAQLTGQAGRFTFRFEPDSVYTLTTTTGQRKGDALAPADAPFPLPFTADFEHQGLGDSNPQYFLPQNGAFEIAHCGGGREGQCLEQVVEQVPVHWGAWGLSTEAGVAAIVGDQRWRNYRVTADVLSGADDYAMLLGRVVKNDCDGPLHGYEFRVYGNGRWELLGAVKNGVVAAGKASAAPGQWRRLALAFRDNRITGAIDGQEAFSVTDLRNGAGMAGLGSGWNRASFDNFAIVPIASDVPVIATPPPDVAPPAFEPAILLPVVGDHSVTLHWTPVRNASSYVLRVSTKADGPFEQEFNVGRSLVHTFRGLRNGTQYYFWALAANAAGTGDPSYPQVATPGRWRE